MTAGYRRKPVGVAFEKRQERHPASRSVPLVRRLPAIFQDLFDRINMHQYLIAYAPDEKPLWIVAVTHGSRSPRVMAAILRGREYAESGSSKLFFLPSAAFTMARNRDTQPLNALYISVVNIAEIRFGIDLQEDPARRAELNDWLRLTLRPAFAGRILPLTEDILLRSSPRVTAPSRFEKGVKNPADRRADDLNHSWNAPKAG
jgi:hypothetical protein